jgi:hypothetical protein
MSPAMSNKLEQPKEIIKDPEPSVHDEDDFFEGQGKSPSKKPQRQATVTNKNTEQHQGSSKALADEVEKLKREKDVL